jgi:hypothetical protein
MIPITTRLHIIIVLTIVGVAVYMFLLYKELRIFEKEIYTLRGQVNSLSLAITDIKGPQSCAIDKSEEITKIEAIPIETIAMVDQAQAVMHQMDDDASVSSNEIHDLIDNIEGNNDADEQQPDPEPEPQCTSRNVSLTDETVTIADVIEATIDEQILSDLPTSDTQPLSIENMNEEQLMQVNYDDLRLFMKNKGEAIKGRISKESLVKKVLTSNKSDA